MKPSMQITVQVAGSLTSDEKEIVRHVLFSVLLQAGATMDRDFGLNLQRFQVGFARDTFVATSPVRLV